MFVAFTLLDLSTYLFVFLMAHISHAYQDYADFSTDEGQKIEDSVELSRQMHILAALISRMLDREYPCGFSTQGQIRSLRLHSSIGISIDPSGDADDSAMAYLWQQETVDGVEQKWRPGAVFRNVTNVMQLGGKGNHLGAAAAHSSSFGGRQKRAPRRGGGMGGGGRGSGGGGRGASGARGSGGRFGSGRGGSGGGRGAFSSGFSASARPRVWLILGVHSHSSGYHKSNGAAPNSGANEAPPMVNDVRIEVSLCFGSHVPGESCSSKVDALVKQISGEPEPNDAQSILTKVLFLLFGAGVFGALVITHTKQYQRDQMMS